MNVLLGIVLLVLGAFLGVSITITVFAILVISSDHQEDEDE